MKLPKILLALWLMLSPAGALAGNIDPGSTGEKFIYGENAGWINLAPAAGPGVTVTDTGLTGFAWGENIGWINLSPTGGGVANDGQGNLSGFAWAENMGWINFSPAGGGVHIDSSGVFSGKAWGENTGWISFGSNGAVPFSLTTSWIPQVPNQSPTAAADSAATIENTPVTIDVLANDTDPDGDPLAVSIIALPAWGEAVVNANGTITYTSALASEGTDTFIYTVSDGMGGISSASVTVSVNFMPVIAGSLPGGTYIASQLVSLGTNEPATIYYTLDGTEPTTESAVYRTPIIVSRSLTLKYFAVDQTGAASAVNTEVYNITGGFAKAWGLNNKGQLGDGTIVDKSTPVKVNTIADVIAIDAGETHTAAVKNDGTVWTWGENLYAQLGDGSLNNSLNPVNVAGLAGIVKVSSKFRHTLALKDDGTVWAWGWNYYGELGNGSTVKNQPFGITSPVQAIGLSGVQDIAAGSYHSLALHSDGTVSAWGYNQKGQLGDGTRTDRLTPVPVSGLSNVVAISAGWEHSLALASDGTVWAWGYGGYGQLGNGDTIEVTTPTRVNGLVDVVAIAAGGWYSLALKSDGTVWKWGLVQNGIPMDLAPVQVNGLTDVAAIADLGWGYLALKGDGTIWAEGENNYGQLGDGTTVSKPVPVQVTGISNAMLISAGGGHSLAITSNTPPALAPIGNRTVSEGQRLTFNVTATDADGGAMTLSATGLPPGAAFDPSTGAFTYTPGYDVSTSASNAFFNVFFEATDANGAVASETVTITVMDTLIADLSVSMIAMPSLVQLGENLTYTMTVTNNGPNTANSVVLGDIMGLGETFVSSSVAPCGGEQPRPADINWCLGALQAGASATVQLVTQPGTGKAASLVINEALVYSATADPMPDNDRTSIRTEINRPPVMQPTVNRLVNEGEQLIFTVTATDSDGDAVTFRATGLPAGAALTPAGVFSYKPGYGVSSGTQNTSFDVVFEAVDSRGGISSQTVTITVVNVPISDLAVSIAGPGVVLAGSSMTYRITLTNNGPDDADRIILFDYLDPNVNPVSADIPFCTEPVQIPPRTGFGKVPYWCFRTLPAGASEVINLLVQPATGTASIVNLTSAVLFRGVDPNGSNNETRIFTAVNNPPVLSPIGNRTVNEGARLAFTVSVRDIDNDRVTLVATGLPPGASFNSVTGDFNYVPAFDVSTGAIDSFFDVTFEASDGRGGVASETVRITVIDVAGGTAAGTNVTVTPVDRATGTMPVTLIFDNILIPGYTDVAVSSQGHSADPGFRLGSPPTYYEITSTAVFNGNITVCFNYAGISFRNENRLKVRHYEDTDGDGIADKWVTLPKVSQDTFNNVICATTNSLSPFSVMEQNSPPVSEGGIDSTILCLYSNCIVTLNGSGSNDPDSDPTAGYNDIVSYSWYENYGQEGLQIHLGDGVKISPELSVGVHSITLVVTDSYGDTATDTFTVTINPAALSLFEVRKAEVEWDKKKIKVNGTVALPVGRSYSEISPMGSLAVNLSSLGTVVKQSVTFSANGASGRKWEYKGTSGLTEFKVDWEGERFDYNQAIRLKSNHIGQNATTLEIDRKGVTGPLTIVVGTVNGATINIDEMGAVTTVPSGLKVDADDDGEVEVELPFQLTPDMTITISGVVSATVNVADHYTVAVGKFEAEALFDPGIVRGDVRPATLKVDATLGEVKFPGSASVNESDWTKLELKEWKMKK